MPHFQSQLWRVLVLGKVIGSEAVPQAVIWQAGEFGDLPKFLHVEMVPPVAEGIDFPLEMPGVWAQPFSEIGRNWN